MPRDQRLHNADEIVALTRAAGQLALARAADAPARRKPDGTWQTAADREVESFLRVELARLGPVRVFGEEEAWTGPADAPFVAIVDPIDGTALLRDHLPLWGVSVALFHEGLPLVGVFHMPAAGLTFVGGPQLGARRNDEPLRLTTQPVHDDSYLGLSSDGHHGDLRAFPGKIRAFGASGLHVALVAAGQMQAALLTRYRLYDVAGAALVLQAAGGALFYLDSGQPVPPRHFIERPTAGEPVLACHPELFAQLRPLVATPSRDRPAGGG